MPGLKRLSLVSDSFRQEKMVWWVRVTGNGPTETPAGKSLQPVEVFVALLEGEEGRVGRLESKMPHARVIADLVAKGFRKVHSFPEVKLVRLEQSQVRDVVPRGP